ncbi:unnamed protein product [Ceutorhynchus assimilis]|uniref:Cilia- and flagella-associated protein 299 n=1 Tax=Ceutorhynchus assimilis TaxID=467358 RepID=A0A9N9N0H5_9CUCU|nr:unnamed protein product [Ceutorhynchus assimilis]
MSRGLAMEKFFRKPPPNELALLHFPTYENYLDSFLTESDQCYLQDRTVCRKIAELGYRRDGLTYSREDFDRIKKKVLAYLSPIPVNIQSSSGFKSGDSAQNALAIRERANRVGLMSTIIFVSYTTSKGREVSGYIDFSHSLLKRNWKDFFMNKEPVYPERTDLGYFNWRKNISVVNDSLYFKTMNSPIKGLLFQHKMDRMVIYPDPYAFNAGRQTTRKRFYTDMYNIFVLIDHTLRCRK